MEIVSQARPALVRRGQGLSRQAAHHPALSRHLRRQHGTGFHARRRQRLGAQARRRIRHALRDQERQFNPLCRAGDRIRGAPPDRHSRGWRHRSTRRPGCYDPKTGETRSMRSKEEAHDYRYFPDPDLLPLEFDDAFIDELLAEPARTARRQEGALHRASTALSALRRDGADARARDRRLLRGGGRPWRQASATARPWPIW